MTSQDLIAAFANNTVIMLRRPDGDIPCKVYAAPGELVTITIFCRYSRIELPIECCVKPADLREQTYADKLRLSKTVYYMSYGRWARLELRGAALTAEYIPPRWR